MTTLCWLLSLFAVVVSQYSLDFSSTSAFLQYSYDSPVNFTDNEIKFKVKFSEEFVAHSFDYGSEQFLSMESEAEGGVYDLFYIDILPNMVLMATFTTPKSSKNLQALPSYCLNTEVYDFYTDPKEITIKKTGQGFTLAIEGLDNPASYYCSATPIGADGTGEMTMSKVKLSAMEGCFSQLNLPGVDLLSADQCENVFPLVNTGVIYRSGSCSSDNIPTACPTEAPPTTTQPEVLPDPTTTPQSTTEQQATTQSSTPSTTRGEVTDTTPLSTTHEIINPPEEPTTKEEEDVPVVDPQEPDDNNNNNNNNNNNPTVVDPDHEEDEDDNNKTEYEANLGEDDVINTIADEEASTGERSTQPVIIIICVVAAGILVVVILLYIGYRFHFRDKGSYKLEEVKTGEPADDNMGNEYAVLKQPNSKDQEWYL